MFWCGRPSSISCKICQPCFGLFHHFLEELLALWILQVILQTLAAPDVSQLSRVWWMCTWGSWGGLQYDELFVHWGYEITVAKCFEYFNCSSVCSIISHNFLGPNYHQERVWHKFNIFYRGEWSKVWRWSMRPDSLTPSGRKGFLVAIQVMHGYLECSPVKKRLICPLASVSIEGSSWIGLALRSPFPRIEIKGTVPSIAWFWGDP